MHVSVAMLLYILKQHSACPVAGGNTDHPAEGEIRALVKLCHENDSDFISRWIGCGNHKTALICKHISEVMCEDKAMHVFSHKQFGYVYRYVFHDGSKNNIRVVKAFANDFMGSDGFWCQIPKMMQDQRSVNKCVRCVHAIRV